MVSAACVGMNRELVALRQTGLSKIFGELIDIFIQTKQKIVHHDRSLKTGIGSYNVIVTHLSVPTLPDNTLLNSLKEELQNLQESLDETTEGIKALQKARDELADARARHRAEQATKQRKDRQILAEMRSLLALYQSISNIHWDRDRRCFFLAPHKAKLIEFPASDDKFKLLQKNKEGSNICVWDLLSDQV